MIKMFDMKKILTIVCLLAFGLTQAQDIKPLYEKDGDIIKVTHFYNNGNIKEQGFYKNKLLNGTWTRFDEKGNKTVIAHYKEGKKTGKWFMWSGNELKEINYENNAVANVQTWKEDSRVAVK